MRRIVEICVENLPSAIESQLGGADRVELCLDRSVGGVTPPLDVIKGVCQTLSIPVQVLIRPRPGDFVYGLDDVEVMRRSILECKALGVSGIVLGALRDDRTIDKRLTAELTALSRPLSVTFHKAFDETVDPIAALDFLIELGVERVLTSGQAATAREGRDCLTRLVDHAQGRIAIMAGGSLTLDDVPGLISAGLPELHAGSCVAVGSSTKADRVRALVEAVRLSEIKAGGTGFGP